MTTPCPGDLTPFDLAERHLAGPGISDAGISDVCRALLEMRSGALEWANDQWSRAILSRYPAQRLLHRLGLGGAPESVDLFADAPNTPRRTP